MAIADLPAETRAELERIQTVSDKIRLLDRQGYERAKIARILGKRYQHVRNVLEQDVAKAERKRGAPAPAPRPGTSFSVERLTVARDGTLRLSPELMSALEIPEGGVLSAQVDEGALRLVEPLVALRRVQEMLRPWQEKLKAEGISLADELIAERRAEAAREEAEAKGDE